MRTAIPLIAAAMFGAGAPALAQTSLRDMLGERHDDRRGQVPAVARYVAGDGAVFVLDRSGRPPLLKFEQSVEVWVLYPSPAPRGDIIYRNDAGLPVLRATKLGGLTLFTSASPGGVPVALDGEATVLRVSAPVSATTLLQRLAQASVKATGAAKRLVPFEAASVTPGAEAIYADAAAITAEAIVRLSQTVPGRTALARVRKVRLTPGQKPAAQLQGGVLQIVVAPALAAAGRPSSEKIVLSARTAK